jgi:putative transposase
MLMRKSFQYRLRLTKKQKRTLDKMLDGCRWLYNLFLEQRILSFEELGVSLTKCQQLMFLPELKEDKPELKEIHSQVLQNIADRLDKAFQAFFRRHKAGEKPGFPRFRGVHRYNSICYPQSGFDIVDGCLKLSKVGSLRIKMHRPIEGTIKTCTLRKTASGDWNVSFSCEVEIKPAEPKEEAVGIDMGLSHFAVFSNKEKIANPRFFKKAEKKLAKIQRQFSKLEKGSKERLAKRKVVAKIHEKISNQRKDFCHKESRKIIDRYQFICIEDLDIKNMVKNSCFAKNIMDASWNQFCQFLTYKAEEASRKLGLVNPAYTTQTCSQCWNREKKELWERMHCCMTCGYKTTRDHNASQIVLALGIDGLGNNPRSSLL